DRSGRSRRPAIGRHDEYVLGQYDPLSGRAGEDQSLTGTGTYAQRHLLGCTEPALRQQLGDPRVSDTTAVDCHDLVAPLAPKACPTVINDAPHRRSVARARTDRTDLDGRLGDSPDPTQRVDHHVTLQVRLSGRVGVLEVAPTTATSDVWARWLDAVSAGFEYLDDLGAGEVLVLVQLTDTHELARECTLDEQDSSVGLAGETGATGDELLDADRFGRT
ncbi:MAG: hypothetical protein GY788_13495, partial [bacterium]|nr:hypothetical protein [bacterium]